MVKKDSLRRKRKDDCLRVALFSKKSSLFSHVFWRSQDLTPEWAMEEATKRVTYTTGSIQMCGKMNKHVHCFRSKCLLKACVTQNESIKATTI